MEQFVSENDNVMMAIAIVIFGFICQHIAIGF